LYKQINDNAHKENHGLSKKDFIRLNEVSEMNDE